MGVTGSGTLGPRGRAVLTVAAVLTVLIEVFSDGVAGEPRLHVATLGMVVAAVVGVRVSLGGRHRRLSQLIAACITAQPVLHALIKLVPHGPLRHGSGFEIGLADVAVVVTQVVLVVAVVAAICLTEHVVVALTGVVRACWVRIVLVPPPPAPPAILRRAVAAPGRPRSLLGRGPAVERGPPSAVGAAC